MNSEARKYMEDSVLTLRRVRENMENASRSATNPDLRNRIDSQLSALVACLEECEHISGNISQI